MGHKAFLLAAILAAVCRSPPWALAAEAGSPPVNPPSVLLLTLDTTRADALGAFGGRGARTPVLDALAARGTRWEQAITSTSLTLPAHSSLFTGLAPPEYGVEDKSSTVLPESLPTLAEAFSARGYSTAGFVASLVLSRSFGLTRGFGAYDDHIMTEPVPGHSPGERTHGIFLYPTTLHVPLILAGPGVPRGQVVREAVATRRLAAERHRADARRMAGRLINQTPIRGMP